MTPFHLLAFAASFVLILLLWLRVAGVSLAMARRDRFRLRSAAGLAAAFAAVALALNVEFSAAQLRGVALAAGAAVAWSVAFVLMAQLCRGGDTRPATFYATAVALACLTSPVWSPVRSGYRRRGPAGSGLQRWGSSTWRRCCSPG